MSAALLKLVNEHRDDAVAGHTRLRTDYREMDDRTTLLEAAQREMGQRFAALERDIPLIERRASDLSQLKLSPGMVASIVLTVLTVAGGMWASTYGLRSDVRDILTRMAAQEDARRADTRLQDERAANMVKAIEGLKSAQTMQDLKINTLTEKVVLATRR